MEMCKNESKSGKVELTQSVINTLLENKPQNHLNKDYMKKLYFDLKSTAASSEKVSEKYAELVLLLLR